MTKNGTLRPESERSGDAERLSAPPHLPLCLCQQRLGHTGSRFFHVVPEVFPSWTPQFRQLAGSVGVPGI